jgi:outer membrane protein assembly factor BamB
LWIRDLPAESLLVSADGESFTGDIEPDGTLRLLDLASGKETMVSRLDPRHAKGTSPFAVSDDSKIYLGLHRQPEPIAGIQSAFVPASGIGSRPIHGELYALDKSSGKVAWRTNCLQQSLVLENIGMIPVVILASRSNKPMPNNPAARIVQPAIRSYDKRTGKLLFEKETPSQQPLLAMAIDTRKGTVDLISPQNTITHQVVDEPGAVTPPIRDQALPGGGPGR